MLFVKKINFEMFFRKEFFFSKFLSEKKFFRYFVWEVLFSWKNMFLELFGIFFQKK